MRFKNVLFGITIVSTCTVSLACEYPRLVPVPVDQELSEQDLVALDAKIDTYVSGMQEFLTCNREEGLTAGEDVSPAYVQFIVARHDQAVREVEAVATLVANLAEFNGVTRRLSIDRSVSRQQNRRSDIMASALGRAQIRIYRFP
jgi:hypothetical protein